jgi:Rrf2 family nitric oxide-sensitive transcriptional repressor
MIPNKTTEYALTILGFMATRNEAKYSAEYLHQQLNIPRRYLRRLLTDLANLGFLISSSGRNGGFIFAQDLKGINLSMVIDKLKGSDAINNCILGFSCCIVHKPCIVHDPRMEAHSKMFETLTNTTLADLKEKYQIDPY